MLGSHTLPVVAFAPEVPVDRAAEAGLHEAATIRLCHTREAVLDLIVARSVDAAVVGMSQGAAPVLAFITRARAVRPGLPIVVHMPATRTSFQQIPAVLEAGATEVAVHGYDLLSDVIRMVLAPTWQPGAARALLDIVPPMVPPRLQPFAVACALKGSPRLTVELVADWVETSPRTVRSRLRRASLSPPLAFVKYCSAAHAMCLLYPQRMSPERVVERMRFGTRRALHHLIRGYSERATDAVHERWAYAALLLRPGEFLRRPPHRPATNVERDLERLERYVSDDLTPVERIEFERWVAANALTETGEARERMRQWSSARGLERDLRQRKEETWARLLRSIGSELDL